MSRLIVAAQHLASGKGGICLVGRLSIKALADQVPIAYAVKDSVPIKIDNIPVRPFSDNRLAFVARHNLDLLGGAHALYDFAGTGRANLLPRRYALWAHVMEFGIGGPAIRQDYLKVIRDADLILINSHFTARAMERTVKPKGSAHVCWLGTEEDDAPLLPPEDGPPLLLFVGRSDEHFAKGQDILIRIWPTVVSVIKDARLCFVGEGVELERLRNLARQSSAAAQIDVLGFQTGEQLQALWRRATATALLGNLEGFGLVVVEAMRQGVPVIASTNDASCEINVDDVTGYNIDRQDEAGITERVIRLLKDRDLARRLGANGVLRWQEHFRFSIFKARFRTIIDPWLRSVDH